MIGTSIELIQSTYEAKDFKIAQKEAQQLELEIYDNATSEVGRNASFPRTMNIDHRPHVQQDYDSQLEARLQALVDPPKNLEAGTESEKDQPPTLDHSSQPTKRIGVYQAVYHASGAFSTVYKAIENSNGTVPDRLIALKVTKPSQAQAPHDPKREARILAAARNASVISLLSTFSISDGYFVLSFPFARLDLASLLDAPQKIRKNAIYKSQTRNHLQSLFSALAHIHSLGIIHRDIKPSNILLEGPGGPAYLADFGIAYMPADPASEPTDDKVTDVGTTCYRPPELLFGNKAYGTSLDLWAAGCVVAETVGKGELFDAGDLGSEFALIKSQFSTLGTPTDETWPVSPPQRDQRSQRLKCGAAGSARVSGLGQIRVQGVPGQALDRYPAGCL